MSIIYSLVSRGSTILAEYTDASGNFTIVTQQILDNISSKNERVTLQQNQFLFHYVCEDEIVYLCLAEESFGRRIPFTFLEDIKNRFRSAYGNKGKTALAYAMNEDFSKVLKRQMDFYSNNKNADRLNEVRGEIQQVKEVMVQNIEKVLERGEKMDLLVDKTDHLNTQSQNFKKKATQLKRAMWWQNTKLMVLLVFIGIILLYVIICFACGFPAWGRCIGGGGSGGGNFTGSRSLEAIQFQLPNVIPNPVLLIEDQALPQN